MAVLVLAACEGPTAHPDDPLEPVEVTAEAGDVEAFTFDEDEPGGEPAGASVYVGSWRVRQDEEAPDRGNVLCQETQADFPAIQLGDEVYGDVDLQVDFKPLSGEVDQAAGLIFGLQNRDNYYVIRANALEANVAFYIYEGGARRQLGGDGKVPIDGGRWQQLKVEVRDGAFTAFVDGKTIKTWEDETWKTGGVGLWTKADSTTCFDDFKAYAAR